MDGRKEIIDCVKSLYGIGLTSISGNHSMKADGRTWIASSGFRVTGCGADIHHARKTIESIEGWPIILAVAQLFGGATDSLG